MFWKSGGGEFEATFSDVNEPKEIFNFIENPFHLDVSSLTPAIAQLCPSHRAALESEIVEMQTNANKVWCLKQIFPL